MDGGMDQGDDDDDDNDGGGVILLCFGKGRRG